MKQEYLNIINLPHHTSTVHKPMTLLNRATQFAPFAALVGFDDYIYQRGKEIKDKPDIYQDKEEAINLVLNNLKRNDSVSIVFYRDQRINFVSSKVAQIDIYYQKILLTNKLEITFNEIIDIYEDDN